MGTSTGESTATNGTSDGHTAVVFFHGMGSQRHYESISMLVEMLASHAAKGNPRIAEFWNPKYRRERIAGDDPDAECACVQIEYSNQRVRFYEAYWAPAAVEGTNARSVMWWLMSQVSRPIKVLRAPWRSFSRLRRADLIRMRENDKSRTADDDKLYEDLNTEYSFFVEQRLEEKKDFDQFLVSIANRVSDDSYRAKLVDLANRWHSANLGLERRRALVLAGIGLGVVMGVIILIAGVFALLGVAARLVPALPVELRSIALPMIEPTLTNVLGLLVAALGVLGITNFLVDSLGDVQQFVTYEDTEALHARREKILSAAETTLRHVLASPEVKRVVIVAHSLGTAVAYDSVLRIHASNLASDPTANDDEVMHGPVKLELIQQFVTSGSPIDKINYFFATLGSSDYSFENFLDWLRGDIGAPPFSKSGGQKPWVHWVNFWDVGDVISGPLETVSSPEFEAQRVDNVRIATYLLPDPIASHGAYFGNELYAQTVFEMAFHDGYSFATHGAGPSDLAHLPWIGDGVKSVRQSRLTWLSYAYSLLVVVISCLLVLATGSFSIALPLLGSAAAIYVVANFLHKHWPPLSDQAAGRQPLRRAEESPSRTVRIEPPSTASGV